MSIKIHHGPPGSYKTSGAIADDLIGAVLAGRHVITNVRGLSDKSLIAEVIEKQANKGFSLFRKERRKVPATFDLTYIKTDPNDQDKPEESCSDNMEMLRRFWHWAPDGAFFILDEVQEIWPKTYRETHLKKLEYPGGIDAANQASRFLDIALAFEKHRHKNWDFIVTTPNISKVHPVVRGSSEAAYKHKNLALLGELFRGRYIEGFHAADTNGKTSDFYSVTRKKVPPYVFNLYKSTATGIVQDTTAGQSLFRNPKILGLGLLVVGMFTYLASAGLPRLFSQPAEPVSAATNPQTVPPGRAGTPASPAAPGTVPAAAVSRPPDVALPDRLSFIQQAQTVDILIAYTQTEGNRKKRRYALRFNLPDGRYLDITDQTAPRFGLTVSVLDPCMYELRVKAYTRFVYCADLPPLPDATDQPNTSTQTAQANPTALITPPAPLLPN